MKVALLDPSFKEPGVYGMGGSWARWEIERHCHGLQLVEPDNADLLLATVQSQQQVPQVRTLRKRYAGPPLILGGPGCYAPAVFDGIADGCCVGEGRRFLHTLSANGLADTLALPEAWIPGESREVVPNADFPWDCPPIKYRDRTTRIVASRGCRRKCLFCQTGWEAAHRSRPDMDGLYQTANALHRSGALVSVAANDQGELDWSRLPQRPHVSATVSQLRSNVLARGLIHGAKSIRVGVEGVSARIRSAVGKAISHDALLRATTWAIREGVTFRWFMIAGLPGETDADWAELREAALALKREPKGCVMMHFHAFMPHPATPLGVLPLADDGYWDHFQEFRRWFFDGPGATRRIQIMACGQPPSRLKAATQNMAATEAEVRRGWFSRDNPNWRVRYTAEPDLLRRIAVRYARRVGLDVGGAGVGNP